MNHSIVSRTLRAAVLTASLTPLSWAGPGRGQGGQAGRLEVMTQNLYVGAGLVLFRMPLAAAIRRGRWARPTVLGLIAT